MITRLSNLRLAFSMSISALALVLIMGSADAGGPMLVDQDSGAPIVWARSEFRGGPLNSQTVDAQGRVVYRVDSGPLGTLSNAEAVALTDHIFSLYSDIPGSSLDFVNGGPILDPDTGQPVDVTIANVGKFLGNRPTLQNPIIFDSDNSIVGDKDVLGLAGVLAVTPDETEVVEGTVVLNGSVIQSLGGKVPFQGVFTHEFGHFAGPLDHSQINGNIASSGTGAKLPPGFDRASAFDLYAPFTETMYPFLFPGSALPPNSVLGSQGFINSGFFTASLDMDTQNAMSNLYPTAQYLAQHGAIEGRVIIKTASADLLVTGINVVARRIDQAGTYPPVATTVAFPNNQVPLTDGVPNPPPDRNDTDALATAASAVTGYEFPAGAYRIQGLPPGQYIIEIQQINPNALDGSGIGPLANFFQFDLGVEEFYNGALESGSANDVATAFTSVTVNAGQTTPNIDIVLNVNEGPAFAEREPNEKVAKAQRFNVAPGEVTGTVGSTDAAKLKLTYPDGQTDKIEDLYRFTLTDNRVVYIILEPTSGVGDPANDLDLFLFTSAVGPKKTSTSDDNLIDLSISLTSFEFIPIELPPGTYIVGVSSFSGNQNYRLRVSPAP